MRMLRQSGNPLADPALAKPAVPTRNPRKGSKNLLSRVFHHFPRTNPIRFPRTFVNRSRHPQSRDVPTEAFVSRASGAGRGITSQHDHPSLIVPTRGPFQLNLSNLATMSCIIFPERTEIVFREHSRTDRDVAGQGSRRPHTFGNRVRAGLEPSVNGVQRVVPPTSPVRSKPWPNPHWQRKLHPTRRPKMFETRVPCALF